MGVLKQPLEQLQLLWATKAPSSPNHGTLQTLTDSVHTIINLHLQWQPWPPASTAAHSRLLDIVQPQTSFQNADVPAPDFSPIKTKTLPQVCKVLHDLTPVYLFGIIIS